MKPEKCMRIKAREQGDFAPGTEMYVDIDNKRKIKAVVADLIETSGVGIRAFLFEKSTWDEEGAKKWVRDNRDIAESMIESFMPLVKVYKSPGGEPYEIKDHCLKLQDIDEKGQFKALGARNGNIDGGGDRFFEGNWKKTIQERGRQFPLLHSHDFNFPLGSHFPHDTKDGLLLDPGILDLSTLGNGNPMVPKAYEDYSLYKNGHLDTFSVGWNAVKKDIVKENGEFVRNVFESKLYEVSMAPVAMNDQARMISMKGVNDIFGYVLANIKNKDLKYSIFSLYYPHLEPELLEFTLQKACDGYFASEEIAIEEPETETTPAVEVEPKGITFLERLHGKIRR